MTTFSRLLTAFDLEPLERMLHSVELLSLQQFDTEHSFLKKIRFVYRSIILLFFFFYIHTIKYNRSCETHVLVRTVID